MGCIVFYLHSPFPLPFQRRVAQTHSPCAPVRTCIRTSPMGGNRDRRRRVRATPERFHVALATHAMHGIALFWPYPWNAIALRSPHSLRWHRRVCAPPPADPSGRGHRHQSVRRGPATAVAACGARYAAAAVAAACGTRYATPGPLAAPSPFSPQPLFRWLRVTPGGALIGGHYLSQATCLKRPHLFYACFVVSWTIIICYTICHF